MDQGNGATLGNYGNSYATPAQSTIRREGLRLREGLWSVSSIPDVRKCGRVRAGSLLPVRQTSWGYRLGGLCRCHSVWVCPVCAPEIRAARGAEIGQAVELHLGEGRGVTFGSATVRHGLRDRLRGSYSAVAKGWAAVTQDGSVRRFRERHGYVGFCRACEMTWGAANGWHPHVHWLDFWEELLSDQELAEYEGLVYSAWSASVVRQGMGRPSRRRGVKVKPVRDAGVGDYVTALDPFQAGHELTSLSTKAAKSFGLTPFDVLRMVVDQGGMPWTGLWWEYEGATRGRRMLGTSRGLLGRLGLSADEPDPEALEAPIVGFVEAADWDALAALGRLRGAQLVIESGAVDGQLGIHEAVSRLLLGRDFGRLLIDPIRDEQLELFGPGDDGGWF